MSPTQEEVHLFRLGGHNAETLAALSMAKRTGLPVSAAREALKGHKALPYVTPEEEGA